MGKDSVCSKKIFQGNRGQFLNLVTGQHFSAMLDVNTMIHYFLNIAVM